MTKSTKMNPMDGSIEMEQMAASNRSMEMKQENNDGSPSNIAPKALRNYYIISYSAIIALHGLMIYGAVASMQAYYASPLNDIGDHTAGGYFFLSGLLTWAALSWIFMYVPVDYARHNKTLINCPDNEADYNNTVNGVGEDTSLTQDGARQQ